MICDHPDILKGTDDFCRTISKRHLTEFNRIFYSGWRHTSAEHCTIFNDRADRLHSPKCVGRVLKSSFVRRIPKVARVEQINYMKWIASNHVWMSSSGRQPETIRSINMVSFTTPRIGRRFSASVNGRSSIVSLSPSHNAQRRAFFVAVSTKPFILKTGKDWASCGISTFPTTRNMPRERAVCNGKKVENNTEPWVSAFRSSCCLPWRPSNILINCPYLGGFV